MLPIHSRRRCHRPLLLPPGWVALGWLLLLGCLLLQSHWRQLRLVNVLQLTMPPLKQDTTGLAFYQRFSNSSDTPFDTPYKSVAELDVLRPWHTIYSGGQPLADFFSSQTMESTIRLIQRDSSHAGGVRIRFRAGTTYANLVKVLNIMNYTGQKRYWLDTRRHPITLYAITNKELPLAPHQVLLRECILPLDNIVMPPILSCWQRFLTEYWPPAWRLPWLLLLALGTLSAHKLIGAAERRS